MNLRTLLNPPLRGIIGGLLIAAVLGLLLVRCYHSSPTTISKENSGQVACVACALYYALLINGQYESFVDGTWHEDSIPESYRQELILNVKQFDAHMKRTRQGIKSIKTNYIERTSFPAGSAQDRGLVHATLTFGDNTTEEVVIPMSKHNDNWYLE